MSTHSATLVAVTLANCRLISHFRNNVIPIVMGARLGEYRRLAPPHSFIHVDQYDSLGELASYLELLNLDDDLYNEYFRWKPHWKLVDQKFACR